MAAGCRSRYAKEPILYGKTRQIVPQQHGLASAQLPLALQAAFGARPSVQPQTSTLRRTPAHMYVAIKSKTASEALRARTKRISPVSAERHAGHDRVCSSVSGGDCMIWAWNLVISGSLWFYVAERT
jgi:hypothetical protein